MYAHVPLAERGLAFSSVRRLIIYNQTNKWVYPITNGYTPLMYVVFNGAMAVSGIGFYLIGNSLGQLIWSGHVCPDVYD